MTKSRGWIDWWSLSDDQLEAQCDRDHFRASGPGGQHRNKTDSGVRLRHRPTGLIVTATERRSQAENRSRAIRRLREALAFDHRPSIEISELPAQLAHRCAGGRFQCRTSAADFLPVAALLLALIDHCQGRLSDAAGMLGVSTASVAKFLSQHDGAWQAVQRLRIRHGLAPLRP